MIQLPMKEIEITEIPPLKPNEQSLLHMHTLLNILNVLRGELTLIGLTLANDDALLKDALENCDTLIRSLRDPSQTIKSATAIDAQTAAMTADVDAAIRAHPGMETNPEIVESVANLQSVYAILRVRAKEILARAQTPDAWREFSIDCLLADFRAVFAAIEKNSHGRYRLLLNVALQEPCDYYIDFKIESVEGQRLSMPPVFQDVIRDLIANARKYTPPGGRITAALHAGPELLRFHVEDTGRGIPEEEMASVVEFGHRASNVSDVRTMGGGFGLTKAFLVTKQFGGRFFLASALGRGTRVRIHLPRTAHN
jgi:signal transduction histidine kinase